MKKPVNTIWVVPAKAVVLYVEAYDLVRGYDARSWKKTGFISGAPEKGAPV